MRSYRANHNLMAVSAYAKETAVNTEQTFDVSMMNAIGDVLTLDMRRENNGNEATGYEEPDQIYDNGALAQGTFNYEKMQPQHAAFIMAYALGTIANAAAGTGYLHTITPLSGDLDANRSNPSFSAMQRLGNSILKRQFCSLFVDSFTFTAAKDDWVKLSADIKGTGKYTSNISKETVTANGDATTLTLAANAVEGSTAATRLDSIHRVRVALTAGVWTEVTCTAVSAATPAALTITSAGGAATPFDYEVLYVPDEAADFTFPAKVQETPLRVSELTVVMGGKWTGSAFAGGRALASEINSIEWKFNNNLEIEFTPGSGGAYASSAFRNGREQTITLDRKMKEAILQQLVIDNEEFGLRILCEGAIYDSPHKYQVEIIFPQLAILKADPSIDGKVVSESSEIQVMEDATYGSVIVMIKNLQAAYAA